MVNVCDEVGALRPGFRSPICLIFCLCTIRLMPSKTVCVFWDVRYNRRLSHFREVVFFVRSGDEEISLNKQARGLTKETDAVGDPPTPPGALCHLSLVI